MIRAKLQKSRGSKNKTGDVLTSFQPFAFAGARILILGTMPGPESLRRREYYGHPRNQFWRILQDLFGVQGPISFPEKVALLRSNRIAIWDVLHSCIRTTALDADIRGGVPNAILELLAKFPSIKAIFFDGKTAQTLFQRHFPELRDFPSYYLPSTSPAHAALSYSQKIKKWRLIREFLK